MVSVWNPSGVKGLTYEDYIKPTRYNSISLPEMRSKTDGNALFTQFVTDRNRPLDPTVMTMLEDNNLADALRRYAADANPASRMFAKTFAKYAGNTQVRFEDRGEQIAGVFSPRTNTITFNTDGSGNLLGDILSDGDVVIIKYVY